MLCPLKFSHYEFEGGQDCIGTECGMHNLCNADNEITAVEFDALDEHAQALERENEELRKLCGANDALAAGNGVSEASMDANDGSELQDSREKLEVDVITTFGDGLVRSIIMRLLDRQAAITERDLCRQCSWPSLAAMPDKEAYDRIAELKAKLDQMTVERDILQDCVDDLNADTSELQKQVDELTEQRDRWRSNWTERNIAYSELADECQELEAKVDELTAELERETLIACNTCAARIDLEQQVEELTSELAAARKAHAQAEHEAVILREKLGRMLDNAHEITRIGGDC